MQQNLLNVEDVFANKISGIDTRITAANRFQFGQIKYLKSISV